MIPAVTERRCPQGHVIAGANAYVDRSRYLRCRICRNEAQARRRRERELGIPAAECNFRDFATPDVCVCDVYDPEPIPMFNTSQCRTCKRPLAANLTQAVSS